MILLAELLVHVFFLSGTSVDKCYYYYAGSLFILVISILLLFISKYLYADSMSLSIQTLDVNLFFYLQCIDVSIWHGWEITFVQKVRPEISWLPFWMPFVLVTYFSLTIVHCYLASVDRNNVLPCCTLVPMNVLIHIIERRN